MPDDYSADRFTAGTVAVGGSATGTIETAHDQDWFAVELVAGRTYQFDLGGSPSEGGTLRDTYLRAIYDSEGRYQSDSYNDDFGGSRDSRVTFTPTESGTYYVRASGDRDETGSYTLSVRDVTPGSVEDPPPADPPAETVAPDEPEPARAAAEDLGDITELAAPRFPLGTLDGAADAVAWYRFTLSEAREVALGLRRQDADADLVVEDAAGNVLHSGANDGTANEWVRETLLAGTYYVRVEAQEAGANAYVFRYGVGDADPAEVARLEAEAGQVEPVFVPGPPETELETSPGQSTPGAGTRENVSEPVGTDLPAGTDTSGKVEVGGSVTGNINAARDHDWFAVELEAGREYQIDLEGSPTERGTLEDPWLPGIYDSSGTPILGTGDDDGGENFNSRMLFTPDATGTYYVAAAEANDTNTGTYTLSVRDLTPQSGFVEGATDLADNANTTGEVEVDGFGAQGTISEPGRSQGYYTFDRDWFAVELEAGQTYQINLEGGFLGLLPQIIAIYDADSNILHYTSDRESSGPGDAARVEFTPNADSTYYISASGLSHTSGGYELTVSNITDTEDSDPHTADRSTDGRVTVGDSATGKIDFYQDFDWFKVTLTAGTEYQIDLEGRSTGSGSLYDPRLRAIFDANGNEIPGTDNDDGGAGYNSRMLFTPDATGTHYVAAGAMANYEGTYTLSVEEADAM